MRLIQFTAKNKIDLLYCGAEFFPALLAAIDLAKVEIYLETYIFSVDEIGNKVCDALIRATTRGVRVHVITDWLGTGRTHIKLLEKIFAQTEVKYRIFNPWFHRGVVRSHRKLCVVDQRQAFVGGGNINHDEFSDTGARIALPAPRWDFSIRVEGPLVDIIYQEAVAQWLRMGKLKLANRLELFEQLRPKQRAGLATFQHEPTLAGFVVRDNFRHRLTIQKAYLRALGGARHSIWLANPYFAPGRKFRDALSNAAKRGVRVTLLVGVGEFCFQDAVARSFYPKLIKSGVHLVEYRKTQLHAKVAVVDDEWATVGSSNCDGLSLFVNQEANVVVKDAVFATALRARIEAGAAEGVTMNGDQFTHIHWYKRAWYGAAFLIYRGVMRIITLGSFS